MSTEGWIKMQEGVAPDPKSERFQAAAWGLRYGPQTDFYVASVMDAYATLITHPSGQEMLKRIRKAEKS